MVGCAASTAARILRLAPRTLAVYSGPSKRRISRPSSGAVSVAGDLHVAAAVAVRLQLGHTDVVELVDDEEQGERDADGDGDEQAEAQPARRP